jgi:hypothetical protein
MIAPYAISGVCLLLACGSAQGIFPWLRRAHTMSRWPTVRGKISSSWAVLDGEKLAYAYQVGGGSYVGHHVWWVATGGSGAGDATPQELAEKYPPGSDVTVYYDPSHPAHAVLEPRNMRNAKVAIVATVAFSFFGLAFLAAALR